MTTEQTAEQLELAAQILRTGHPWELKTSVKFRKPCLNHETPQWCVANGFQVRPILATPPDNRPLHNPDNLTAEQVGVGWRLVVKNDSCDQPHDLWSCEKREWFQGARMCCTFEDSECTYRLPLSVPWPPAPVDPYAELKAAHAAGKVIQFWSEISKEWKSSVKEMAWCYPPERYRIKPDAPPFQLPPPPPGMQWHSTAEWQESDLPQGMRPLVADEFPMEGDECIAKQLESKWHPSNNWRDGTKASWCCNYRTTRPLVFTHAGKQWTYHRPGDPMPCDGERRIDVLMASSYPMTGSNPKLVRWSKLTLCDGSQAPGDVIGWRYAEPTTKEVELGPEDVPPGSVFRSKDQPDTSFWTVSQVWTGGFYLRGENVDWPLAMQRMEINRSVPLTGKWNPDAWEPCHKTLTEIGKP